MLLRTDVYNDYVHYGKLKVIDSCMYVTQMLPFQRNGRPSSTLLPTSLDLSCRIFRFVERKIRNSGCNWDFKRARASSICLSLCFQWIYTDQ
ncbi:hypothetical protein OUZ56_020086 [Daphnia magna]|uniref:Uncharacterized protein n=1 Tax=Daphnia magna TaxID=35525 RepID=A0ABQ9ZDJ3_9CRUS|nr:hypothetical protein OUZ56_020086 [Daphnia magna]